jgi:chromosome segregation ATPase
LGATDKDVDVLYGLPLEQFTNARNELAAELRAKGDREAADSVKALVKPTRAAWAVNQVMRTQTKDARDLLDAGARLRKVHAGVTSGTASARDLRGAVESEREAVRRLTDAARGLMNTQGGELSESILERVTQTLHALSADSEVRSVADATRLSAERRVTSAGLLAAPASEGRSRKSASSARASAAGVRKARERLQRAQREARDLRSSRTRAARAVADVERALVRAREEMRKADQKVAEKETEVEELRRRLDELR